LDNVNFLVVGIVLFILYKWLRYNRSKKQIFLIDNYRFPDKVIQTLQETYPHLKPKEIQLVIKALREYFHLCHQAFAPYPLYSQLRVFPEMLQ
jgi:hypothetical protein